MADAKNDIVLSIRGMSKSFGRNRVLDHIDLDVRRGTVMGLMGENGAGKSTMMKCLFGTYQKDEGKIFLNGKEISFSGPKDALENGIAMVHQELNQCLERNVIDNLFLGRYPTNSMGVVDEGGMKKKASELFRKLGMTVNLTQPMRNMSVSQRQMCEIAKAISYNSQVIVLDEPTSGMDLQSGAARVDLLPAGQTYAPSPTPAPTQAVQTPSPTPVIPIRENAIQSLNKRDTSNVQEVSAPTDTPSPRTRLTEYPGNPLKNVMESLLPLIDENSDVVGQLTIPGVLEEVVVQRNNTYYLTHNYRGSSSDAGAVFVDESCSLRSPPENLLLRGQGTIEGKVFAPLWQYATAGRDFVASATTAHLTTLHEEADYVLFAVIRASSNPSSPDYFNYAGYSSFATDGDMLSYIETARTHSLYSFNVDVTASDRLLTLATLGSGNESLVLLFRQMR